jgi:hypothetical protein
MEEMGTIISINNREIKNLDAVQKCVLALEPQFAVAASSIASLE